MISRHTTKINRFAACYRVARTTLLAISPNHPLLALLELHDADIRYTVSLNRLTV